MEKCLTDSALARTFLRDCGLSPADTDNLAGEVIIYRGALEDYTRQLVADELVGPIPEAVERYLDYRAMARDLLTSGSACQIDAGVYVINADNF